MNTSASQKLAIDGGTPVICQTMSLFSAVGEEEVQAATEVIRSGVLSAYIGAAGDAFMGGPRVRTLEAEAAEYFGTKNSIVVNSRTSTAKLSTSTLRVSSAASRHERALYWQSTSSDSRPT